MPGEAVDGRYALLEFLFPHGASPPLHTHPQDESYVVLEGTLTIQAGDERFVLEAGGAAAVPMGVQHTFRVESATAHVLVLSTPAGLERMVRDASVPATARVLPPEGTPRPTTRGARTDLPRARPDQLRPPAHVNGNVPDWNAMHALP